MPESTLSLKSGTMNLPQYWIQLLPFNCIFARNKLSTLEADKANYGLGDKAKKRKRIKTTTFDSFFIHLCHFYKFAELQITVRCQHSIIRNFLSVVYNRTRYLGALSLVCKLGNSTQKG